MDFIKKQDGQKKGSFTDAVKKMDEKGDEAKELSSPPKKLNNDQIDKKLFHDQNVY